MPCAVGPGHHGLQAAGSSTTGVRPTPGFWGRGERAWLVAGESGAVLLHLCLRGSLISTSKSHCGRSLISVTASWRGRKRFNDLDRGQIDREVRVVVIHVAALLPGHHELRMAHLSLAQAGVVHDQSGRTGLDPALDQVPSAVFCLLKPAWRQLERW